VGNAGTVFIEMGGKVVRRSGRQAGERRKVITHWCFEGTSSWRNLQFCICKTGVITFLKNKILQKSTCSKIITNPLPRQKEKYKLRSFW
jgi:hypothetical protein